MTWDSSALSILTAATALAATVMGPLVSLTVSRRQVNATVLSANRQRWIEEFRDTLAELLALLATAAVVRSRWRGRWDHGMGPLSEERSVLEKIQRLVLVQSRLRLLASPGREDQQAVCDAVAAAIAHLRDDDAPDSQAEEDIRRITALAQPILRQEWQRVKRGT